MGIDGTRVLVTGASAGIGRALAVDLAGRGATVLAVARREDRLEELAAEAPGIVPVEADVTDPDDRRRLARDAVDLDVLVNNAGTAWTGAFGDMTADDVRRLVEVDLVAVVELCRLLVPGMVARGSGHVLNIGSILGFAPGPPLTVYSALKAGVHAFTEGLRRETEGTGVHVTLVAPGPVDGTEALADAGDEQVASQLRRAFDVVGTSADEVVEAVRLALEHPGLPGTRTITVPRSAGASRVLGWPAVGWTVDQAVGLLRRVGVRLP